MPAVARCLPVLLFAVSVMGHGAVTEPPPRPLGPAYVAACGQEIRDADDKVGGTLRIWEMEQLPHDPKSCDLWLCKGRQFADSQAKNTIQQYKAGQEFGMKIQIQANHPGTANVSIVNLEKNQVIGEPLKSWDDFGNLDPVPGAVKVDLVMPDGLDQCSEAGKCAIQWYWDGLDESRQDHYREQQYETCVDFAWSPKEGSPAQDQNVQQKAVQPLEDDAEDEKTTSIVPTTSQQEESAPQPTLNINMPGDFGNAVVNDGDSRDHHYGNDDNPPRMNKVEEVPGVVSGESIERKEEGKDYEIVADSSAMRLSGLASLGLLAMFAVC